MRPTRPVAALSAVALLASFLALPARAAGPELDRAPSLLRLAFDWVLLWTAPGKEAVTLAEGAARDPSGRAAAPGDELDAGGACDPSGRAAEPGDELNAGVMRDPSG